MKIIRTSYQFSNQNYTVLYTTVSVIISEGKKKVLLRRQDVSYRSDNQALDVWQDFQAYQTKMHYAR